MFGFSPYSTRNIVGSLCVDARICKHERLLLRFPGIQAAWEGYSEALDADLVAEQEIWAALEHPGKRSAFNCGAGDVFRWRDFWRILAEQFEFEFVEFEEGPDTFEAMMREGFRLGQDHRGAPTASDQARGGWDMGLMPIQFSGVPVLDSNVSSSTEKSNVYNFCGSRNTQKSFGYWIEWTKMYKIVP